MFDEQSGLAQWQASHDRVGVTGFYYNKLFLCFLFARYHEAVAIADLASEDEDIAGGWFCRSRICCFDSLARLAVFPEGSWKEKRKISRRVSANQKRLKKWARHAPMNHLHLYHLVEAERGQVRGEAIAAAAHYEQAVSLSRASGFINDAALALELAGQFHLRVGKTRTAKALLQEARDAYQEWGAQAKVKDLVTRSLSR